MKILMHLGVNPNVQMINPSLIHKTETKHLYSSHCLTNHIGDKSSASGNVVIRRHFTRAKRDIAGGSKD